MSEVPVLFGRERELQRVSLALAACLRERCAAALRICGASGLGKSALLEATCGAAEAQHWIVFRARCYQSEQNSPAAAVSRLLRGGIATATMSDPSYVSGLEDDLRGGREKSGRFARAFAQLIEAIVPDSPCLVAIDDAQWLDAQTAHVLNDLATNCTSAPFFVATAEQAGFDPPLVELQNPQTVVLEPLAPRSAQQLVRFLCSGVPTNLANAIIERSACLPFDIVQLCDHANSSGIVDVSEIGETADRMLRETVMGLGQEQRSFLQFCSIMSDPIDLRTLIKVVGSRDLMERHLARTCHRYLQRSDSSVQFRHARIRQVVRSTIDKPDALGRRVLEAYGPLADMNVDELGTVATLSSEIGDSEIAFAALFRLGALAFEQNSFESATAAFQRASSIRSPNASEYFEFYRQYSNALTLSGLWEEARTVLERAIRSGLGSGYLGSGDLAAALVWLIRLQDDRDVARTRYRQLASEIAAAVDRHGFFAIGVSLACEASDEGEAARIRRQAAELVEAPSGYASVRMNCGEAALYARLGDFERAWQSLDEARRAAIGTSQSLSVDCYCRHAEVRERGCVGFDMRMTRMLGADRTVVQDDLPQTAALYAREVSSIVEFARGRWTAAKSHLDPRELRSIRPCHARTLLLAIGAAIASLETTTSPLADLIEEDLRECFRRQLWQRARPLAYWWAAAVVRHRPGDAAALVEPLRRYLDHRDDVTAFSFPFAPVLYAVRARDRVLLERLVQTIPEEAAPWHVAQSRFARGIAFDALGEAADARRDLIVAEREFRDLGADFFAAFSARILDQCDATQSRLLKSLHIDPADVLDPSKRRRASSKGRSGIPAPTLREREVAELIADGYSNRKIAERLSISERTVEVHIASLFGKLNLSSRTQIVRWVVQETSPVIAVA